MTDKPAETAAPETETKPDSTLRVRKLVTWVLAALIGGSLIAFGIKFFLKTEITATVPISFLEVPLLPLAAIPMTFFFMIWIDKLLKTGIVND
jgi:hypothetical protein